MRIPAIRHVLFAILLLLAQQMATAHAYSHVGVLAHSSSQETQLPGESLCDQCLALCSLASALGGAFSPWLADPFGHTQITLDFSEPSIPASFRPFNSRAPPIL